MIVSWGKANENCPYAIESHRTPVFCSSAVKLQFGLQETLEFCWKTLSNSLTTCMLAPVTACVNKEKQN